MNHLYRFNAWIEQQFQAHTGNLFAGLALYLLGMLTVMAFDVLVGV